MEHKDDSYVVDVIHPAKTAPYPMICVCPRKKNRPWGKVGRDSDKEKFLPISSSSFDTPNIEETARLIGRAILDDSQIIRDWRGNRP